MREPLHRLSAVELARLITAGEASPETVTRSFIDAIHERERDIQAFAWFDADRAIASARELQLVSRRGPLHGLPVAVKDNIETADIATSYGSPIYLGHRPNADAACVAALKDAGAYVLGKTVCAELANFTPGPTRNPHNLAHTPGGSSSGSAAAVAAHFAPLALGTQTAGSVIRPAAFCGVVGYKPSFGQMSTNGMMAFATTLDQPGVFARNVADAAFLASCLTANRSAITPEVKPLRSTPRLAAVRSPVWHLAQPEQRLQFETDIRRLRDAGAAVDVLELPLEFDGAHKVHRTIMYYEAARLAQPARAVSRSGFSDYLNAALDEGEAIRDPDYREALKLRGQYQQSLAHFFDRGYSAIITPPAAGEAPATLANTGDPRFCTIWTLAGVPAITLPTGLGPKGMPLGLQLIGAAEEENYLLATAAWCERHSPFRGLV